MGGPNGSWPGLSGRNLTKLTTHGPPVNTTHARHRRSGSDPAGPAHLLLPQIMSTTYSFGDNTFGNCWIPIVFHDRCFLVEPGPDGLLVSVVMEVQGKPGFEVLRNEPGPSPAMEVTKTAAGI